jgi:signal transduction histidine kinase/CheY-like chemotaxis protein
VRPAVSSHHEYSTSLVLLSVLVAILASYTALDLSGRIHAATGRARAMWVAGGGAAMGFGIWSMHFVGMLALHLTIIATYAPFQLVTSLGVAMGASSFALWIASRSRVGHLQLMAAAAAMGIAIAGMHYVGMAGMRVPARMEYDPALFASSIAIAIGASFVALVIARRLRDEESSRIRRLRTAAAVAMGLAIAGMHYTGMAAMRFVAVDQAAVVAGSSLPPFALGIATALAGIIVAGLAMIAAMLDRIVRSRLVEDRLRAEKVAAERTNRTKSEFLANMSHELRTPLNSIIGFANILLKNRAQSLREQDLAYLSRIAVNGTHLLGLIDGVLDVSKIEAGRMELDVTSVDLALLVRETLAVLEPQAGAREVELVADLPSQLSVLDTDRTRLKQILINLVGNAVKFTRNGRVTVRVHADAASSDPTRIDVIDSGIGIAPERLETIFDAFQQADATTAREYGGTGLGLTITRAVAGLLGWEIVVSSTVGAGSTFSVVMMPGTPSSAAEAAVLAAVEHPAWSLPAVPQAGTDAPRPVRVLVIDDDRDARRILEHQLADLGCEVVTAASCDEGTRLARRTKPDLITLDIMMPRKGGMDALLELKADPELRNIPVVMVSVVAGEQRRQFVGAVDWIDKPVTRDALLHVIARHLVDRWQRSEMLAS